VSKFRAARRGDSPRTMALKRGTPIRNRYFTAISSSSMRTVAYRHRFAAYHNKHCWRPFRGDQHRWPWTTLDPKIGVLVEKKFAILGATHISRVNCAEINLWWFRRKFTIWVCVAAWNREKFTKNPILRISRQHACEIKLMLSRVSWALAHIFRYKVARLHKPH